MKSLIVVALLCLSFSAFGATHPVTHLNGNHTATTSEEVFFVDSNAVNLTLPSCSSNNGQSYVVRALAGWSDIYPANGEKMEGNVNGSYNVGSFQSVELICDGSNSDWHAVNYY